MTNSIKKKYGYGLSENTPVQLSSIASSYHYINGLNSFDSNLSYERKGSIKSPAFENMIDVYEFKRNNSHFCNIYIYPYAIDDNVKVPKPFQNI